MNADGVGDNCGASPEKYTTSLAIASHVLCRPAGGLHETALAAVLLQVSGHLAGRAGGHAPARMQRSTSPRICTLCVRALRTRRARPVNEACAHAAAGRGRRLPLAHAKTCVHAPKCAPACAPRAHLRPHARPLPTRNAPYTPLKALWCGIWRCHALCPAATPTCVTLSITLFKRKRSALRCAFIAPRRFRAPPIQHWSTMATDDDRQLLMGNDDDRWILFTERQRAKT